MESRSEVSGLYRTEGNPAPGELVRLQGFLNTWSEELGIEDFATPAAMEQWLRASFLWDGGKNITIENYQRILSVRHLLRQAVQHSHQMTELEKLQFTLSFTMEFDESGAPNLKPLGDDCDKLLGRLMLIIYNSMTDGSWSRFKCCALESCGWAFFDSTRSRTKRWCSMRTCGSRHKARQYYKRQR
jgi:predicted RNA-binding Zn ribbon-like protein